MVKLLPIDRAQQGVCRLGKQRQPKLPSIETQYNITLITTTTTTTTNTATTMALAAPPGKCCITGVRHEGKPTGSSQKIGQIDTYVAYPEDKSTDKAILFLTDAFGHNFINNKLVADDFATNG